MGGRVRKKGMTGAFANHKWVRDSVTFSGQGNPNRFMTGDKIKDRVTMETALLDTFSHLSAKDSAFVRQSVKKIFPTTPHEIDDCSGFAVAWSGKVGIDIKRSPELMASTLMHETLHASKGAVPKLMSSGSPFLSTVTNRDSPNWKKTEVFTTEIGLRTLESVFNKGRENGMAPSKLAGILNYAIRQATYRAKVCYGKQDRFKKLGIYFMKDGKVTKNASVKDDVLIKDIHDNGFGGFKDIGVRIARAAGWED